MYDLSCIVDQTSQVMNHILHFKISFVTYHKNLLTYNYMYLAFRYHTSEKNIEHTTYNKSCFILHKTYLINEYK